jgi:ribosome-associated protein
MQDQELNQNFEDNLNDDEEYVISKSQIKREMTALQELGKKLIDLKANQLAKMPITEELMRAVKESKNITQREATRRHLQFIGKLMRDQDAEAIQYALDEFDSSSQRFAQATHELEVWRTRLIEKSSSVVTEYVEKYPKTNIQHLRQLIRNAIKDQKNEKNTGAGKKLFQYLKDNSKNHE